MGYLKRNIHWLIFLIGFFATGWSSLYISSLIDRKAHDEFRLRMQDLEAAIVTRLSRYEDILFGVAGLFRAAEHVTPQQFNSYADALAMKERFPALDVINFAEYVPKDQRTNFIRTFQDDTGGQGGEPALPPQRDEYMVITRIYPNSHAAAVGVDVLESIGMRVKSADGSDRSKRPRKRNYSANNPYSSGLPLRPRNKKGTFLASRLGVYKGDKFIGTSGIGFEISPFFKEAVPKKLTNTMHFVMFSLGRDDDDKHQNPIMVFDSLEIASFDPAHFRQEDLLKGTFDIRFGGAVFRVEVESLRDIRNYERHLPFAVLVIGWVFFAGISLHLRRIMFDKFELQREISRTKSLERELAVVIESERLRMGRELHDDLGQRLTGISISAEILASELLVLNPKLATKADELERAASEAMMQVRTLAHGLMPVASGPEGLLDALTHLATSMSKLSGIRCTFDFDDPVDIADESVSTHLYRIAQEAVNNAIRHARARSIELRLDERNGKVLLTISDDGCGFDNQAPAFRSGLGLKTITYRASIINFGLEIKSSIGNGTVIRVAEK